MDPIIHTLIAVGSCAASYYIGKHFGYIEGVVGVLSDLHHKNVIKLIYNADDKVENIVPGSGKPSENQ